MKLTGVTESGGQWTKIYMEKKEGENRYKINT